jgi:hypothetical protein
MNGLSVVAICLAILRALLAEVSCLDASSPMPVSVRARLGPACVEKQSNTGSRVTLAPEAAFTAKGTSGRAGKRQFCAAQVVKVTTFLSKW